jgi:hypothetical protein
VRSVRYVRNVREEGMAGVLGRAVVAAAMLVVWGSADARAQPCSVVPIEPGSAFSTVQPTGLRFEVAGNLVHLAWDAMPSAIDYIVDAGRSPGASDFFAACVGLVTSVTALVPSGRYYVRVRARTGPDLVSVPSPEVVIDVGVSPSTPPAWLSFAVSGTTVTLQWQSTSGAVDYVLEAGNAPGASNVFAGAVGAQTTVTATVPTGRYFVRVRARTAGGLLTLPSEELMIDVAPAGVPPPPANLHLIATKIVGVLMWDPSPGAIDYIVEAGSALGATNLATRVTTEPLFTVMQPPPGRYFIRVRARNTAGVSAPSNEIVVDVP